MLEKWSDQGAEILYLSSHEDTESVEKDRIVLARYGFPKGEIYYRQNGETYGQVVERVGGDIVIEDDCESIGGEVEMTYPQIREPLKSKIKSIVVKEFEGIDHLPERIVKLRGIMQSMVEYKKWNVVFLVDQVPPERVVVLQRSANKSYAPNFLTGIGGKIELNEKIEDSAYRELEEETGISRSELKLEEFARCVYEESDLRLYYFAGVYKREDLPKTEDGKLSWVSCQDLLSLDLIPTTKLVCEEWARREFEINAPFTVRVEEVGVEKGVRIAKVSGLEEGLA